VRLTLTLNVYTYFQLVRPYFPATSRWTFKSSIRKEKDHGLGNGVWEAEPEGP
jgi:hypothetical protein